MSFLPIALAVVGGVAQAAGALSAASANAKADQFNAEVEQRNEKIALAEGAAEAADQKRKNEIQLGRLRAQYGAAGIDLGGDALGVYQDSAAQGAYDLAKVRYDAKLRSIGYGDQAKLDTMKQSADSTAGVFGALGAGVNAGTSILRAI